MFYGLPVDAFRSLAYDYAVACESKAIPSVWKEDQKATRDWYYAFMKRRPELSLKTPEGMSIARAMDFNRVSVDVFSALTQRRWRSTSSNPTASSTWTRAACPL